MEEARKKMEEERAELERLAAAKAGEEEAKQAEIERM
jgi:hypothetical protein